MKTRILAKKTVDKITTTTPIENSIKNKDKTLSKKSSLTKASSTTDTDDNNNNSGNVETTSTTTTTTTTDPTTNNNKLPKPRKTSTTTTTNIPKKEKLPRFSSAYPHTALRTITEKSFPRKFDETIELILNTTLDTRKQNQQLRVVADLPYGLGKRVELAVFTSDPENARKAREAGVAIVGGNELVDSIAAGTTPLTFQKSLASPEMNLNKIARILGPRGLMPSKKLGTVVDDIEEGVRRSQMGTVELRANKSNIVQIGFGKRSMPLNNLIGNLKSIMLCIENNRPSGVRGKLLEKAFLKTCMGPPVEIPVEGLDPKSPRFLADVELINSSQTLSSSLPSSLSSSSSSASGEVNNKTESSAGSGKNSSSASSKLSSEMKATTATTTSTVSSSKTT
jgi:large subunit ribosomal protein L1